MAKYRIIKTEKTEKSRRFIRGENELSVSTELFLLHWYVLEKKMSFLSGGGWEYCEGVFAINEDEAKTKLLEKLEQQEKVKQQTLVEEFKR